MFSFAWWEKVAFVANVLSGVIKGESDFIPVSPMLGGDLHIRSTCDNVL